MAEHNVFGKEGEEQVVFFLEQKSIKILETNWYWNKAEVDIIAIEGNYLLIVEVKTRKAGSLLKGYEAISEKKKKLLILAANQYVEQNNLNLEVRFDVASVTKKDNNWQIDYIDNAFDAVL